MGWKGTTRSFVAAARRIDRENKRIARENIRIAKEHAKQEAYLDACATVDEHEALVDELQSVHCAVLAPPDWSKIARQREPGAPARSHANEALAARKLEAYSPGFFDKLFGLTEKRRKALADKLQEAKASDDAAFSAAQRKHETDVAEWRRKTAQAKSLLAMEIPAEHAALTDQQRSFSGVAFLGRSIDFRCTEADGWTITLAASGIEKIPDRKYGLLQSGKLSEKTMPKGERMALHQQNVCGAALRCAVEFFNTIHRDSVRVEATLNLLDA